MSVQYQKDVTQTTSAITLTTTTETLLQTSNNVPLEFNTAKVHVSAVIQFTPGAGVSLFAVRIYRGNSLVAPSVLLLQSQNLACVAAAPQMVAFDFVDIISGFGQVQYTVSLQQANGAANGTVNSVSVDVELISG